MRHIKPAKLAFGSTVVIYSYLPTYKANAICVRLEDVITRRSAECK